MHIHPNESQAHYYAVVQRKSKLGTTSLVSGAGFDILYLYDIYILCTFSSYGPDCGSISIGSKLELQSFLPAT